MEDRPSNPTVVISCQGTIQLVSALAAMKYDDAIGDEWERHLFISDLYVEPEQIEFFVAVIKELAEGFGAWVSIEYLGSSVIPEDQRSISQYETLLEAVSSQVTPDKVHTLYVSTTSHSGNRALIAAFREARVVCYGDGPGIFIPDDYRYLTRNELRRPLKARIYDLLRAAHRAVSRKDCVESCIKKVLARKGGLIDHGMFLLPRIYGADPGFEYVRLQGADFLEIFREMAGIAGGDRMLRFLRSAGHREIKVLLTSNFSEAGRMEMHDEIRAYYDFVAQNQDPSDVELIVKPHPRDSAIKLEQMKAYFGEMFNNVLFLESAEEKFVPLEIWLLKALEAGMDYRRYHWEILAVSSAVLSLKYVMGANVRLGFGEKITGAYFAPDAVEQRLKHEVDLGRLLQL